MTGTASPSSPKEEASTPPQARILLGQPWTHEETANLIDAYHEKRHFLNKAQLRASNWEELAKTLRLRCRSAFPSKTGTQCRHKMEKLRQRYKAERRKSYSSWVYFHKMDAVENGPPKPSSAPEDDSGDSKTGDDVSRNLDLLMGNGNVRPSGCRNPVAEMAAAVRQLGDGFVKLEQRKMEMMREVERMRMEMEMKRVKLIIKSQRKIADAFVDAFYARKKRATSPDS